MPLLCEAVGLPPGPRSRRVRHHVNPLKLEFLQMAPPPLPLPPGPVEVELGCADARFLFERARQHPGTSLIGIEIRPEWVRRVNERARAQGVPNVAAVHANINQDLPALFRPGQVDRFFLNFPDPWFKRAQHKRRVLDLALAEQLRELLRPGGELLFQSDVFEVALAALEVLERTAGLTNVCGEWSFCRQNPYGARSLREIRAEERGLRIWRLLFQRATAPQACR
ncbi:MAG: tRNA (guanosine(46)-N7)-methyltransferase TrmB [Myxococcales bacterium]|nr:tRNA (guanosine(46)-N7)-methyltransferase TrmB [Myxococcota bacterium]MDW8281402.1 tRNA (guanosine(46)-N7)-methyltransferase TrmB [Myxococcales bacterium]